MPRSALIGWARSRTSNLWHAVVGDDRQATVRNACGGWKTGGQLKKGVDGPACLRCQKMYPQDEPARPVALTVPSSARPL